MAKRKLFRVAVFSIAALSCGYQLYNTLQTYFRYTTVSRMELVQSDTLELMSVSLCVPYLSFLNTYFVKKKFNLDLTNLLNASEFSDYEMYRETVEEKITVREIIENTFNSNQIVISCSLRYKSSRYFHFWNDSKLCNELFTIKKYFTQDSICYLFEPKQIKVPALNYFTANMFPGVKYSLGLNDSFAQHMRYYKYVVHSNIWLPFTSKKYAEVRRTDSPTKERYNIKFARFWIKYLGHPYDEFTCTSEIHAQGQCREYCIMNQTIAKYGRVAYDLDTNIPYDYPAITKKQTENAEFSSTIDNIVSKCMKSCKVRYCLFDYTTTKFDCDDYSHATIYVKTPSAPDTLSISVPAINLLDLFVYIMGALGSWFGFAFIHSTKVPQLFANGHSAGHSAGLSAGHSVGQSSNRQLPQNRRNIFPLPPSDYGNQLLFSKRHTYRNVLPYSLGVPVTRLPKF